MKLLVVSFLFFCIQLTFSQSINLNSHNVKTFDDFQSQLDDASVQLKSANAEPQYFILQFDDIPTLSEREYLSENGITLLDYIQDNAYFVQANKDVLTIPKRKSQNIRSLVTILPDYKIDPRLVQLNIPDYAKADDDKVKIVIQYYDTSDPSIIEAYLTAFGSEDIHVSPVFNQIFATIKISDIKLVAEIPSVQNLSPISPPMEINNTGCRALYAADAVASIIPDIGYGLTGKGIHVGLWDLDCEFHRDFSDRLIVEEAEWRSGSHGVHTGGTIAGAGLINSRARGVAPEATLVTWNFNWQSNRLNESEERILSLEEYQTEITSNSWGYSVTRCPNTFSYWSRDNREDIITQLYPYYLLVYAAGNNQSTCSDGFRTTSNNLKNALHVAAAYKTGGISTFSSFGPAGDGRLIPNITGCGVGVYSTVLDQEYGYKNGTSMACPGVAGAMALLYQRYKETHEGVRPISSLMRAFACNSATDKGNDGPDFKYGYGLINVEKALVSLENNQFFTDTILPYESFSYEVKVPENVSDFSVMLAWNDKEGTVGASKALINDLDLKLVFEGDTILPWVLDPDEPSAVAIRDVDKLNNMEQITLPNPNAGLYELIVSGTAVVSDQQEFALVYEVNTPSLSFTSPLGFEHIIPGEEILVHWLTDVYDKSYTLEYSTDGGEHYEILASDIHSSTPYFIWRDIPDFRSGQMRLRLSNGLTYVETPNVFSVMSQPQNVLAEQRKASDEAPYVITWNEVDSASYQILKLEGNDYSLIGESDINSFIINDPSNDDNDWYAIRAVDISTGAVSERSLAVKLNSASKEVLNSPYSNDFNDQKYNEIQLYSEKGGAKLKYVTNSDAFGIILEGNSSNDDWVNSDDGDSCFLNNPSYISSMTLGNIQANSLQNELELSFDYRQKRTEEASSFFRVRVNGDVVANTSGGVIYDQEVVSYQKVCYNLSEYVNDTSIRVEIEAVCKSAYSPYKTSNGSLYFSNDNYDEGDFVAIDNIVLSEEPQIGVILDTIIISDDFTSSEKVNVIIKNNSSCEISDFPVSLIVNEDTIAYDMIDNTISGFSIYKHEFNTSLDLTQKQLYTIIASVHYPHNEDPDRCSFTLCVPNNGDDLLIGSIDSLTSCDALFTDNGGQFKNYKDNSDSWITISPDYGKNCNVIFSEFSLEQDSDFLSVYFGDSINKRYFATYSGNDLPPFITSNAPLGELTFHFKSNNEISNSGWISRVQCVEKPLFEMRLDSLVSPSVSGPKTTDELLSVKVSNSGRKDYINIPLKVYLDDEFIFKDTLPLLEAMSSLVFVFDSTLDLSDVRDHKMSVKAEVSEHLDDSNYEVTTMIISETAESNLSVVDVELLPRRTEGSPIAIGVLNKGNTIISDWDLVVYQNGRVVGRDTIVDETLPGQVLTIQPDFTIGLNDSSMTSFIEVYIEDENDIYPNDNYWSTTIVKNGVNNENLMGNFIANSFNAIKGAVMSPYSLENEFTVECWLRLQEPVSLGTIFEKGFISLQYHQDCELSAQGIDESTSSILYQPNSFILKVETDRGVFVSYVPYSVRFGEWQHVALAVSEANDYRLYINGEIQEWETAYGVMDKVRENSLHSLFIGNSFYRDESMCGSVDEFRVWNKCLEQTVIKENMMTNYGSDHADMLAYYKFIERGGDYLFDYSSLDNTAIISEALTDNVDNVEFWQVPQLFEEFHVNNELAPSCYDTLNRRYEIILAYDSIDSIIAHFETNMFSDVYVQNQLQESDVTVNDFSNGALVYTVRGVGFNAHITQDYEADVRNKGQSDATELDVLDFALEHNPALAESIKMEPLGNNYYKKVSTDFDIDSLKASFSISPGARLYINNELQSSPQEQPLDYSQPIIVKVVSENSKFESCYSVLLDNKNTESEITTFSIVEAQVGHSVIDTTNHEITVWVKKDADLSWLVPSYTVSKHGVLRYSFISQVSGVTGQDFQSPVTYKVTSEDGTSTTEWLVNVLHDFEQPVLTLIGDAIVHVNSDEVYYDLGATAFDNANGDISGDIVSEIVSKRMNSNYYYYIKYSVSDEAGNVSDELLRKVVIDDISRNHNVGISAQNGKIGIYIEDSKIESSMAVFDLKGEEVYRSNVLNAGETILDPNISRGLYLIKVNYGDEQYIKMIPLY